MKEVRRALCLLALLLPATPYAAEVWLQPAVGCGPCGFDQQVDAGALFNDPSTWPNAAAGTQVLVFTPWWLESMSDAQITDAIAWMDAHGMTMALVIEALPTDPSCGGGVEGFEDIAQTQSQIDRLAALGAHPGYVAMDEPLWGGHYWNAPGACQYSIDQVASGIASVLSLYIEAFPDIRIADIEPVVAIGDQPNWQADLSTFIADLGQAVGRPLDNMQFDTDYRGNWTLYTRRAIAVLQQNQVRYGFTYRGTEIDTSDAGAVAHVEQEYTTVEDTLGLSPDLAVFGDWTSFPHHLLPETSAEATTSAVLAHGQRPIGLRLAAASGSATVAAITSTAPLKSLSAAIECWTSSPGPSTRPPMVLTGVVPVGMTNAIIGLRINSESTAVLGYNHVDTRELVLLAGATHASINPANSLSGWDVETTGQPAIHAIASPAGRALDIVTQAGDSVLVNSPVIAVTPGQPYSFSFNGSLDDLSTGAAYAAIIFFDPAGDGFRDHLFFASAYRPSRTVPIRADGTVSVGKSLLAGCAAPRLTVTPQAGGRQAHLPLSP